MKIRVIVNPKAGAGAAEQRVPAIEAALRREGVAFDIARTRAPGEATTLARRAFAEAVDVLAVVGGDGTLNEVSQAYLGEDGGPLEGPSLALIPAGTGGDFRRVYGVSKNVNEAVRQMLTRDARPLDLGVLELGGRHGEPPRRMAFVNIASFGMSGVIDRLVNEGPKWLGGKAAFALGSLRAMGVYRNVNVAIKVDGKDFHEGPIVVAAIANGQFFGGGMRIAPDADPADALFDVVVIGDYRNRHAPILFPRLYKGTHLALPLVKVVRARVVEAVALREPAYVDADGETPGELPLTARLHPGALRIRA